MLIKIYEILLFSRLFTLPMSILSWLIIFSYSLTEYGKVLYGIIALIGICFAHLGTNLFDDYYDYKKLIKQVNFNKTEYLKNSQKTKCRYLISGNIKEQELLCIILVYFLIALVIGIFLYLKCGVGVIYYAIASGTLILLYPLASRFCLSELIIMLIYGPILFGGVYYVMTLTYSWEVFLLSIPSSIMTVVLLYIHSFMDYKFDKNEGKKTIVNSLHYPNGPIIVLKFLIFLAYFSLIFTCIFDILDWQVFITFVTIPLATDLIKSIKQFAKNNNSLPEHKWYHFPMENINTITKHNEGSFMIRMYQARNLMIYFSILFVVSIIIAKVL